MSSTDYTWDAVEQFQWCFAEVNAGIVCASVPALRSFFARYLPGLISVRFRSYDKSKSTGPYDTLEKRNSKLLAASRKTPDPYEMNTMEMDDHCDDNASPRHCLDEDETRLWPSQAKGMPCREITISGARQTSPISARQQSLDPYIHITKDTKVEFRTT
jgi:hypothetical protein